MMPRDSRNNSKHPTIAQNKAPHLDAVPHDHEYPFKLVHVKEVPFVLRWSNSEKTCSCLSTCFRLVTILTVDLVLVPAQLDAAALTCT